MDEATRAQIHAARPDYSTWLTANAGAGKTRVLTNRVARLLLRGVQPENILCLTYTTAAASEMQNRLFETLGTWAMLDDIALREALGKLGEAKPCDIWKARTLFASAIEAPGGLKIQTIHSFCSRVLRQFPMEAGINPQFVEMDDAAQKQLTREVVTQIAERNPRLVQNVRTSYYGDDLVTLATMISKERELFSSKRTRKEIFQALNVDTQTSLEEIVSDTVNQSDVEFLASLVPLLRLGSVTDNKLADQLAALRKAPSTQLLNQLESCLLTKSKPFKLKQLATKGLSTDANFAPLLPRFVAIGERVEAWRRKRILFETAEATTALHKFASPFLRDYQVAKSARGLVDFDDLIALTKKLLTTKSLEWVLYRLDTRIDHILVDEAQDTSPLQWDVVEALSQEMMSGEQDRERTLFVVGDRKQSIYSFQGADTENFNLRGRRFAVALAAGKGLARGELLHSFRSSAAILKCVDAVFSKGSGAGESSEHKAFYDDMPGRVDLWPLVEEPEATDELEWYDPSPRILKRDARAALADQIAEFIVGLLKNETLPDDDGLGRAIKPGDIMILVQRRSPLFESIISACKSKGLDVAGSDRLKVGSELAVRDILALLSFLALPEDDLSLATALRSPLFKWSEQDLFELAAKRKKGVYLWQEMRARRADFPKTFDVLVKLRERIDLARPFELIHMILTEFKGRQSLLERIGPEAEDGIDELLNQALLFEASSIPSLTAFIDYANASDIEVKRQSDASGRLIRVMTVHGAKGLESPIVILPDTTAAPPRANQEIVAIENGLPVLTVSDRASPDALIDAKIQRKAAIEAERDRLLYVAMTRAEKWLIVCGVKPKGSGERLNWHSKIEGGLNDVGAELLENGTLRYAVGNWPKSAETPNLVTNQQQERLPNFSLPKALPPDRPVSPSDLGGDKSLATSQGGFGGLVKGQHMHLLLEHLPSSNEPQALARRILGAQRPPANPAFADQLCAEAMQIIDDHPALFDANTLAEVEVTAFSPTLNARLSGAIDRLIISDDIVTAVDFKTNAVVPTTENEVPEGILRQMGAYLEALEQIYADRQIVLAILWIETGKLMPLKHAIVRAALQRATTS